jgi:hypothetical protein
MKERIEKPQKTESKKDRKQKETTGGIQHLIELLWN